MLVEKGWTTKGNDVDECVYVDETYRTAAESLASFSNSIFNSSRNRSEIFSVRRLITSSGATKEPMRRCRYLCVGRWVVLLRHSRPFQVHSGHL